VSLKAWSPPTLEPTIKEVGNQKPKEELEAKNFFYDKRMPKNDRVYWFVWFCNGIRDEFGAKYSYSSKFHGAQVC